MSAYHKYRLKRLYGHWRETLSIGLFSRLRPVDVRGAIEDPIQAIYEVSSRSSILIDYPIHRCLGLKSVAYPLNKETSHPFVLTLRHFEEGRQAELPLIEYYQRFQPQSIAEALGISLKPTLHSFLKAPAVSMFLPWSSAIKSKENLDQVAKNRKRYAIHEAYEHGDPINEFQGTNLWGPVDSSKIELEKSRLLRLYTLIKEKGFRRHDGKDGDLLGTLLMKGNGETKMLIEGGQHRVAVLCTLGYKSVPIRFSSTAIRREEAQHWPNVFNGIFTLSEALQIFDRIFEGTQP